jgi:hypothetical protein
MLFRCTAAMDGMDNARGTIATMDDGVSGASVVRGFHAICDALSVALAALYYVRHLSFPFSGCSFTCLASPVRPTATLALGLGDNRPRPTLFVVLPSRLSAVV